MTKRSYSIFANRLSRQFMREQVIIPFAWHFITAFILLFCSLSLWAKVTVEVDSPQVTQGQPFRLIITNDSYSQSIPDITPLQQDFIISGSEQSTSVTAINNKIQSETRWIIYLETNKIGKLVIPSLNIGGQLTKEIPITVSPATANGNTSPTPPTFSPRKKTKSIPQSPSDISEDVMLTAEVDLKKPYLNQQVLYTMRLLNSRRLVDVEFVPPTVKDALMFPLGDSNRYEISEQGKRYAVEEQRYAVFPLKSGAITITPPKFSALIYDGFPQRIRPEAPTITLNVKPVPAKTSIADWLPAINVEMEEEYDKQTGRLFVGDTLTREITIKALGITSELLPEYSFSAPSGVNVYSEKPERKNYLQNNEVLGTATFKLTYLFNEPGSVTLPAFQVQWFNTKTGKMESVQLPERRINIIGKPGGAPVKASPPSPEVIKDLNAIAEKYLVKKKPSVFTPWFVITSVLIILALLLISGILYWFWQRKTSTLLPTRNELEQSLKKACLKNDAHKARDYFIQWAQTRWPHAHPLNLSDVGKLTADKVLMTQVSRLSKAIYEPKQVTWSGQEFWQAFDNYRRKKGNSKNGSNSPLPPINPY